MNLLQFQKPSRYINREWNSIHRDGSIKIALCFPDVYEIGMSHLGLKILYEILNSMEDVSAERVFAPWPDREGYLKAKGHYLSSLEGKRPLKEFDIIGFSLQYELSITTVLNMLSLGGIPVLREERKGLPIVIAGGPCTVNPAPFTKFFDALFIGEAEYAINDLVDTVRYWKQNGERKRESLLKALSLIPGFYVPGISSSVKRVIVEDLDRSPYPVRPVVAHQAVHDRLNIEISRGCPMGCRFCQAGMIYRPVRERSVDKIIEIAQRSLSFTGFEEVSFTSLSAGDYSKLSVLFQKFINRFSSSHIALSLPSVRVGAINRQILQAIKSERKTGFTIAPEAGTERLRCIINKDFNDEDYERALTLLFEEGWLNLKLYFMIGLPGERDEDLDGIINMSLRALSIAKRYTKKFVNISVGVSSFIPKPHTPFQWCPQMELEELKRRNNYLKGVLRKKGFNYRDHDPEMSLIEAMISRGNDELGELIYHVWRLGAGLEAWSEFFDFSKWIRAMDSTGIDGVSLANLSYKEDVSFPWDIVDTGIDKQFLLKEYRQAREGRRTPGCEKLCSACGLKCTEIKGQRSEREQFTNYPDKTPSTNSPIQPFTCSPTLKRPTSVLRIRAEFSKTGELKYLSHLELSRLIERALRRANIPLSYTEGFHPMPRISFGPALPVGVEGWREYFDMIVDSCIIKQIGSESNSGWDIQKRDLWGSLCSVINSVLPEDIRLNKLFLVPLKIESLSSFIKGYEYLLRIGSEQLRKTVEANLDKLRDSDGKYQKSSLMEFSIIEGGIRLLFIEKGNGEKVKIMELMRSIGIDLAEDIEIIRTGLFGIVNGELVSPDEVEIKNAE
ncbi:MAG: TIGR03936 family radical SAM-associated protein [Thermodesulfovibrionales bacterium]